MVEAIALWEAAVLGVVVAVLLFLVWVAYENTRDDRRNRKER